MIKFSIQIPDKSIIPQLQDKIDNLTKPKGSLGMLESLAIKIGSIQQTLNPEIKKQTLIMFAADHGIAVEGVSPSPQELTYQMIFNFLEGGAGINFLVRQHHFDFKIVDAGVNFDFPSSLPIMHEKIRKSTRNYLYEAAITVDEMDLAITVGSNCIQKSFQQGCNTIAFGEMGIANTSSSALWMHFFTKIPLIDCVGAGSGFYGDKLKHKYEVLQQSVNNYQGTFEATDIMRYFGGYEMIMTVGGMLKAAELKMIILIDGFIMSACLLAAMQINPNVIHYAIFGHQGDESGHKRLLDYLNAKPILNLGLRLGEGSGALCAFPIVESSVKMINEMTTFKERHITKYF